jgi:hypothetical protein
MSLLPRVTELVREQVAQDFDRLGSDACIAEIIEDLKQNNPEVLDMMSSCPDLLPRVTLVTRDREGNR